MSLRIPQNMTPLQKEILTSVYENPGNPCIFHSGCYASRHGLDMSDLDDKQTAKSRVGRVLCNLAKFGYIHNDGSCYYYNEDW